MAVIGWKRFIVGGLGGLAPVFALLVAIDFERNLTDASVAKMFGYAVRVFALFAVGGFIAWLHENEGQMFKLFEIGVGAPALLAGLITSNSVLQKAPPGPAIGATSSVVSWIPIGSAHAQAVKPVTRDIKTFSLPPQTGVAGFWEGFVGAKPSNTYYVIAGSHLTYEQARSHAEGINKRVNSFTAQVYAPYGSNPYYAVVIGAQLTSPEASALRKTAITAGLAGDTYLWSPLSSQGDAPDLPKQGPWGVVLSGDKQLSAAQHEVEGTSKKFGLSGVKIFMREGAFRTVAVYEDRATAEDALGRAQSHIKYAYLVDVGKWCPLAIQKDAHRECVPS